MFNHHLAVSLHAEVQAQRERLALLRCDREGVTEEVAFLAERAITVCKERTFRQRAGDIPGPE